MKLEIHQWCFQHCHYCNLIPLRASLWLKTCSPREAAPWKEQYVFIGIRCVQYMVGVSGSVPSLMHLSPRLLFHTLYYHTESDWRVRLQQRLYFSLNSTSQHCAPLYWLLRFPSLWETNSIKWREITVRAWYTCFHFRQALMLPGSLFSTTLYIYSASPVYDRKTNYSLHWGTSCEGQGLPVPEDKPVISGDEVHLY